MINSSIMSDLPCIWSSWVSHWFKAPQNLKAQNTLYRSPRPASPKRVPQNTVARKVSRYAAERVSQNLTRLQDLSMVTLSDPQSEKSCDKESCWNSLKQHFTNCFGHRTPCPSLSLGHPVTSCRTDFYKIPLKGREERKLHFPTVKSVSK